MTSPAPPPDAPGPGEGNGSSPTTEAPAGSSNRRLKYLVLVGGVLLLAAWFARGTTPAGGEDRVDWQMDYQAGMATAAEADKPMLVYFAADWCAPCDYLEGHVYSQIEVAERIERNYVPVKVDATAPGESEMALMRRYAAEYLPTLIVADAQGEPLARQVGAPSAKELLNWLETTESDQAMQPAPPDPASSATPPR